MAEAAVIGPMITAFGFRSWYWACRPAMLVAVPGGFWLALRVGMATAGISGAVGALAATAGQNKARKLVERLESASDGELMEMPGAVIYPASELESIVCKRVVLGTNPDFIVTTKDGRRKKYGLGYTLAFDAAAEALRRCYGDVVQGP